LSKNQDIRLKKNNWNYWNYKFNPVIQFYCLPISGFSEKFTNKEIKRKRNVIQLYQISKKFLVDVCLLVLGLSPLRTLVFQTIFKITFVFFTLFLLLGQSEVVLCQDFETDNSSENNSMTSDDSGNTVGRSVPFNYSNFEDFRCTHDHLYRSVPSVDSLTYALIQVLAYIVEHNPGIQAIQLESIKNLPCQIFSSGGGTDNDENFNDMIQFIRSEVAAQSSRSKSLILIHEMVFNGYEKCLLSLEDRTIFQGKSDLVLLRESFQKLSWEDDRVNIHFMSPMKFIFSAKVDGITNRLDFCELELHKLELKSHYEHGIEISNKLAQLFS
jgi:hypothetical protein